MNSSFPRFIRIAAVTNRTGYSRSSIYNLMQPSSPQYDPTFPKQRQLSRNGKGAVAWVEQEVENWIQSRINGL